MAAAAVPGAELPAGGTVYVNNVTGADANDGSAAAPLATIMAAVKRAPVSGRIVLANTGRDYRESVQIQGYRQGRAGAPMVIEGNGATVSGLVAVPAERWTLLRDDLYWFENRLPDGKPGPMPNSNWLMHWKHQGWFTEPQAPEIFFVNGKAAPHTRELETIPAGGFFYDTQAQPAAALLPAAGGRETRRPAGRDPAQHRRVRERRLCGGAESGLEVLAGRRLRRVLGDRGGVREHQRVLQLRPGVLDARDERDVGGWRAVRAQRRVRDLRRDVLGEQLPQRGGARQHGLRGATARARAQLPELPLHRQLPVPGAGRDRGDSEPEQLPAGGERAGGEGRGRRQPRAWGGWTTARWSMPRRAWRRGEG